MAITEAAVGAGITSVLLFIALKRINESERNLEEDEKEVETYMKLKAEKSDREKDEDDA